MAIRKDFDQKPTEVVENWVMAPRQFQLGDLTPVSVWTDMFVYTDDSKRPHRRVAGTQHTVLLPSGTCPECDELLQPFRQGQPFDFSED